MSISHVRYHHEFKRTIVKNNYKNVNKNHAILAKTDKLWVNMTDFLVLKDNGEHKILTNKPLVSLDMKVIIINLA
ncbi:MULTISPECIES: hypothetical protein [Moraxella]|jgi:hypothetical protein|uniref:Uncharacterized protein n=1 Tax=Moraxella lacunata TaxID=477 RepID=A0A1B8Q2A1_MORLA|nr:MULTISPECIES: hypothetical protein [Moraxella]MBE9578876.1 hypothetical protein [Moraxella sp. K1664]MBE9588514.1 hypothetical protein [Moraxella sp. K1630]MBE9589865.1 hypothetical protein [Moraxella sp. K127]MBE9596701.1 hypothetical protein [Moraxella sp. K2450]MDH9218817.1 hypothetical protein [Moraxella lacunata]